MSQRVSQYLGHPGPVTSRVLPGDLGPKNVDERGLNLLGKTIPFPDAVTTTPTPLVSFLGPVGLREKRWATESKGNLVHDCPVLKTDQVSDSEGITVCVSPVSYLHIYLFVYLLICIFIYLLTTFMTFTERHPMVSLTLDHHCVCEHFITNVSTESQPSWT